MACFQEYDEWEGGLGGQSDLPHFLRHIQLK